MRMLIAAMVVIVCVNPVAAAEKTANDVLKKAIAAYGGQAVRDMNVMSIRAQYVGFNDGQNHSTRAMDAIRYDAHITIDFPNKRKDFRWLRGERPDHSIRHWHYDGAMGYSFDHQEKTRTEDGNMSFAGVDRRVSLLSDLAVLKLATLDGTEIDYLGRKDLQGMSLDRLIVQAAGYPVLTLYIDNQTRLLHRLDLGPEGENQRVFRYSSHIKIEGLTYATNSYATRGGRAEMVSTSISIDFNPDADQIFALPIDYQEAPETLSFTEMEVQTLAEGVFLVGQNWGFSVFVDAGDYYIGVGGYHDVSKRFEAVLKHTEKATPLKYQVVTHHHRDHLGGMQELFELGSQFVVHPDHIAAIRTQIDATVPDTRFIDYRLADDLLNEFVQIGYVSNAHAEHNLVAYIPKAKALFTADMYLSRQKTGYPSWGKSFYENMQKLGFDIETLAAAHSGRVLHYSDLERYVSGLNGTADSGDGCPSSWVQCR